MKKYNFLWTLSFMLPCLMAGGQKNKSLKTDPVAQLRQLITVPSVKKVSIHQVSIPMLSPELLSVGYDLKKNMEESRLRCPLLHFESTLELEGKRNSQEDVMLEWKTTNASGSLYFDVERSVGDTLHFKKVNFVWSKGQGIKENYQVPDNNDLEGISYYRVKLQMNDGIFKYSNTIAVNGWDGNGLSVYPNPVATGVWIKFSTGQAGMAEFSLFNFIGEKVFQRSLTVSKGVNLQEMRLADFPAGSYTIKIVLPGKQIRTERITKL